ncbi:MAG: GntR family transcriptional regulator [Pseudomonadota bacterium]
MRQKITSGIPEGSQSATPFHISRNRPAALQVYEDLRDRIVALDLRPGYSLSRAALADFYGVSQTPVREAFLKLEQDGLVTVFPQSKTLIAPISIHKVKSTHFLRTSLELEVARNLALSLDKSKLAPAEAILEMQRKGGLEAAAFSRIDSAFHKALFVAAGYEDLWDVVREHSGHLDRVRCLQLPTPGKIERVIFQHTRIMEAIAASDLVAVDSHVRDHLSGSLNELDAIIRNNAELFGE